MVGLYKIIITSIILWVSDTIISVTLGASYGFFRSYVFKDLYGAKSIAEGALFLNIMRLLYYLIIFIALYYWINNKLQIENKILKLIILNCGLYVFISLLYGFVLKPETKELFSNPLFYILVLSTIISPIVLGQIPYFKKLIESL